MATIDIHDLSGAKVGTLELADEVFGAVNEDLLWEAIKQYRAAQRAGTHATKNKKLVSGSGKKLWRQKGTGRARVGSIRSPLWRHGGTVHGPQPRSYEYSFPRKKLLGALRSALAAKFADGQLMVVENFEIKEPKTKEFRKALTTLKVDGTALLVEEAKVDNRNLELSARNLDGVELVRGNEVHPYHLLRYQRAIFSRPALEKLQSSLVASLPKRQRQAASEEPAPKARKRRKAFFFSSRRRHTRSSGAPSSRKRAWASRKPSPRWCSRWRPPRPRPRSRKRCRRFLR